MRSLTLLALLATASAAEIPRIASILAVGDSITRHGPSEKLGWAGDWGMAASARDKDWIHLLQSRVAQQQGGQAPTLALDAAGGGRIRDKLAGIETIVRRTADLVVVQLGENENTPELIATFEADYTALVARLRAANPGARLVCLGVWGGDHRKDAAIRRIAAAHGALFADVARISADPANWAKADARWTHPGVNWHPGDAGMRAYAAAVWRVLEHGSDPDPAVTGQVGAMTVLSEDFAAATARWQGAGTADAGTWRIALAEPGSAILRTVLPVQQLAGRQVRISARVRAEAVTPRPKAWNGIKVQLEINDAEDRKDWPQAQVAEGSFAWTTVEKTAFIPRNAVRVWLNLGLESVAGTVWFDDVRVEALAP